MKIRIKADGHNIRLWLPTSILKTRIFYRVLTHGGEKIVHGIRKNAKNDVQIETIQLQSNNLPEQSEINLSQESAQQETIQLTRKQQLELYRILKNIIKTRGHFNLVEVESATGEKVLIRV